MTECLHRVTNMSWRNHNKKTINLGRTSNKKQLPFTGKNLNRETVPYLFFEPLTRGQVDLSRSPLKKDLTSKAMCFVNKMKPETFYAIVYVHDNYQMKNSID